MISLLFVDCKQPSVQKESPCINNIIAKDKILGKVRNQYSTQNSLSSTIYNYTEGLRQLEFQSCPDNFKAAFLKHIAAWDEMLPITDKYPDIRGEMHDAFDKIKAQGDQSFESQLQIIWDTWDEVEKTMP